MKLLKHQLQKIYKNAIPSNIDKYLPYINEYLEEYEINTFERICGFLAQIGHESGELRYVEELASGQAYEGRKDLGNVYPGDGVRFKGRGLIQITGRANYTAIANDLEIDCVNDPKLLQTSRYAVLTAFWYWKNRNLNHFCTLNEEDFKTLTKRINGGYNGYAHRFRLWGLAKEVLSSCI